MGRNDFSRLVGLLFFKERRNLKHGALLFAAFFSTFLLTSFAFFQENSKPPVNEEDKHYLKLRYLETYNDHYKMTESKQVKRFFGSNVIKEYSTETIYYFTHKLKKTDSDGFLEILIKIDSLYFRFKEGNVELSANSQSEDYLNFTHEELGLSSMPLGQEFVITVSPYGDIVKIEGEKLSWKREYISKSSAGMKDTSLVYSWRQGLSDNRLAHLIFFKKISIPISYVTMDSIWKSQFALQLNRVDFNGTLFSRIQNNTNGNYTFGGEIQGLKAEKQQALFFGFKKEFISLDSAVSSGNYYMTLNPKGHAELSEGDFKTAFYLKKGGNQFTDSVYSKIKYEFVGRYKY